MKNLFLIFFTLIANILYSQETYFIGKTEYYYNQHYSTTGKPIVKRSETNKRDFLKSRGYSKIPNGYHIDHIIPLSEGGSDDPSNMQLLTVQQHKAKTAEERKNRGNYRSYTTPTYTTPTYTTPAYTTPSSTSKNIQTGSRGGQYYINSNGNKTYIKK